MLTNPKEHHLSTLYIIPQSTSERAAIIPDGLYLDSGVSSTNVSLRPQATYYGDYPGTSTIGLRIANGGAGQSGLIGAWADAFINYMVKHKGYDAFAVEWYLGDTTESIGLLEHCSVDVAVTYNEAAERQLQEVGVLSAWLYGFRRECRVTGCVQDHFYLVGPKSNPAGLDKGESVLSMLKKIVRTGNEHIVNPPATGPATRFLSRFDKSATNIKESELFTEIGQVPWGYVYSRWYHQYPRFPIQALEAASQLGEYTLTDKGTWLSCPGEVHDRLEIYKEGMDDEKDPLLNPAHILVGKFENLVDEGIGRAFIEWVQLYDPDNHDGGQYVVAVFTGTAQTQEPKIPLYTRAPPDWHPDKY